MQTISCIICAYNEVGRIRNILDVVVDHPVLYEVIVVNDGSTDETLQLLERYPTVQVISYRPNRGKTYALGRGIEQTRGELIMLLDADLNGITRDDISRLAEPILQKAADVSFSLRSNSLGIYRLIGLDFVTGERVVPSKLAKEFGRASTTLPRWGGEVYMNRLILKERLSLAVVNWPGVLNVRKYSKIGRFEGMKEELRMMRDAFLVISLPGTIIQNIQLLARKVRN